MLRGNIHSRIRKVVAESESGMKWLSLFVILVFSAPVWAGDRDRLKTLAEINVFQATALQVSLDRCGLKEDVLAPLRKVIQADGNINLQSFDTYIATEMNTQKALRPVCDTADIQKKRNTFKFSFKLLQQLIEKIHHND